MGKLIPELKTAWTIEQTQNQTVNAKRPTGVSAHLQGLEGQGVEKHCRTLNKDEVEICEVLIETH